MYFDLFSTILVNTIFFIIISFWIYCWKYFPPLQQSNLMKTLCKIFSFVKIILVLDGTRVSIWWPNARLQILGKFLRPEQVRREDVSMFVLFVCLYYKIRISGSWTKEPLHSTFHFVCAQTLKNTGDTISTQSERRIDLSSE